MSNTEEFVNLLHREMEQFIDEGYDKLDQQEYEMQEIGLIMHGQSDYYWQYPDEYEKDKKIADLEAKLAESEKLNKRLQQVVDKLRDKEFAGKRLVEAVNAVYEPLYQNKYDEAEQLKQQLAEKDGELHQIYSHLGVEAFGEDIHEQALKEIAEKDQAIEGLQEINQSLRQTRNNDAKEIERLREALYKAENVKFHEYQPYMTHTEFCAEQLKNQTAIEALEKVKESLEDCYGYDYPHLYHFIQSKVDEKIDQQIKELKGEK